VYTKSYEKYVLYGGNGYGYVGNSDGGARGVFSKVIEKKYNEKCQIIRYNIQCMK